MSALALGLATAVLAAEFPFQVQVGNSAYVLYPYQVPRQASLPDQSTLVLNYTDSVRGYQAWNQTVIIIDGPSISSVVPSPTRNVTSTWDVEAAVVAGPVTHGIIHREHGWDPQGPGSYRYNGYITYARSTDAGYSFIPYPDTGNVNDTIIITSAGAPGIGGLNNTGTGPHWAVTVTGADGLQYIQVIAMDYAAEDESGNQVGGWTLARSKLTDGGLPGTWAKYYQGSWSEPGIQGRASAIPGLVGAKMVWLSESALWLAVGYNGSVSWSADPEGVSGWQVVPSSLFPPHLTTEQQPDSYYATPSWFYYQSFIPGWGGTTWYESADSLYLFFAFMAASNQTWYAGGRGLANAQLTMLPRNTTAVPGANVTIAPYSLLSLSQYILHSNSSGRGVHVSGTTVDKWATVWPVDQRVYDYGWHIGYTLASPADAQGADVQLLLDCYIPETNDHFVGLPGECSPSSSRPGRTTAYLGSLGYVLTSNTTAVAGAYSTLILWRCYDPVNQDHYLAPLYGCQEGDQDQTLLGYLIWQND